jgi:hypothetical protein
MYVARFYGYVVRFYEYVFRTQQIMCQFSGIDMLNKVHVNLCTTMMQHVAPFVFSNYKMHIKSRVTGQQPQAVSLESHSAVAETSTVVRSQMNTDEIL